MMVDELTVNGCVVEVFLVNMVMKGCACLTIVLGNTNG